MVLLLDVGESFFKGASLGRQTFLGEELSYQKLYNTTQSDVSFCFVHVGNWSPGWISVH